MPPSSASPAPAQSTIVPVVSPPLRLKPAFQPFDDRAQTAPLVFLLHPSYADYHNILLTLPAFDSAGIHHETARIACAILASCRWDGFLSSSRNGPRLSANLDDVLPPGQYYFCIEGEELYPVVPSFDHFLCPVSLPPSYTSAPIASSSIDDAVRRDVTCRITASALAYETAHIIPAAQSDWWQQNTMFRHMSNPDPGVNTRCANNTILLRRDLHKLWDDDRFAIVPKAGQWVVHGFWNSDEVQEQYHNRVLQPLAGVSAHYFLCRFALAVFAKSPFLSQKVPRRLVFIDSEDPTKQRVCNLTVDELQRKFATRATSRSQSPKKRQRSVARDTVDGGYATEESEDGGDFDTEEEEEERGRARKRKWSPEVGHGSSLYEDRNGEPGVVARDTRESQSPRRKRPRSSVGVQRLQTPPRSASPAESLRGEL